jgi:hypothetical protein
VRESGVVINLSDHCSRKLGWKVYMFAGPICLIKSNPRFQSKGDSSPRKQKLSNCLAGVLLIQAAEASREQTAGQEQNLFPQWHPSLTPLQVQSFRFAFALCLQDAFPGRPKVLHLHPHPSFS